jgi:hypothetical protein
VLGRFREPQFDYLVLLNAAKPVVAVVEMGRHSEHRHVIVHPLLLPPAKGKVHVPVSLGPASILSWGLVQIWSMLRGLTQMRCSEPCYTT